MMVRHSNLRELRVDVANLATLFECLVLPALVSLSCYGRATWLKQEFPSFLRRSSCLLQELVLNAHFDDSGLGIDVGTSLAECLQHTPTLLELELSDGIVAAIGREFWAALTDWGSSSCWCPNCGG
jgi:hypothetical protein